LFDVEALVAFVNCNVVAVELATKATVELAPGDKVVFNCATETVETVVEPELLLSGLFVVDKRIVVTFDGCSVADVVLDTAIKLELVAVERLSVAKLVELTAILEIVDEIVVELALPIVMLLLPTDAVFGVEVIVDDAKLDSVGTVDNVVEGEELVD
jgi:hypothetical protein